MTPERKGTLLSLASAFGTACYYLPFKRAGALVPRDMVVLGTMLVAGVLNTVALLVGGVSRLQFGATAMWTSLWLGLLTVAANFAVAQALVHVGAGVTSILQQTQVLFVAVIGYFLLGERVSRRYVAGAALVVVGVTTMQLSALDSQRGDSELIGILWALSSSLLFALMHVIVRRAIDRIQPITVNTVRLWIAVAVLLCVPGNTSLLLDLPREVWLMCGIAALVGPFFSRVCMMFSVRYISASHSALILLVTPLFAFVLDYAILGEDPTVGQLVGSAIVMAGISLPILELVAGDASSPGSAQGGQNSPDDALESDSGDHPTGGSVSDMH